MMYHRLALFLSLAGVAGAMEQFNTHFGGPPSAIERTYMTIEFDYKLEVNETQPTEQIEEGDNVFSTTPLEDALLDIESNFIPAIQAALPNGDIPEGKTQPDVEYTTVASRFINMCFTESDSCQWVKSRIKLSFVDDRPQAAMERTTLALARQYLESVNNDSIRTTFVYPMIHSSTVQLEFSPVVGRMTDTDIQDLEYSFYNIYHAIVSALDGDTDVSEAHYVYQLLNEDEFSTTVNVKYFGKCRYCTEEELAEIVNEQIEANTVTLMNHLKKYSKGTYFDTIDKIGFSLPKTYDELPPIDTDVFDAEAPMAEKFFPWKLFTGALVALIVICSGVAVICKDQKELRKEEASTGEESESYAENHHEGAVSYDIENDTAFHSSQAGMHQDYKTYVH